MQVKSLRKRIRGLVKLLIPYWVQRAYALRTYEIYYPPCAYGFLPFGLVCALNGLDTDGEGLGKASSCKADGWFMRLLSAGYGFSGRRRRRFLQERADGLKAREAMIDRNRKTRILVALHLFYDNAWPVIAEYLGNLAPYGFDLVVTYPGRRISEKTLRDVTARFPRARVIQCENRGFDVGPFVEAVKTADLNAYDIVFKIHSKGTGRSFIYIYDQIFKKADWFYNLFEGILGGTSAHEAIDALMNGGKKLVAARNLIVKDPPHKCNFVRKFCEENGLAFQPGYEYVAGTCFALRADALGAILPKISGLTFAASRRGSFSAAHAIERIICFPAAGAMHGIEVPHPTYPDELAECRATSALRMLDDPRVKFDDEFFYRRMETRRIAGYEICKVKLRDLRRKRHDGTICTLEECEPYKYLHGDVKGYGEYCIDNLANSGYAMTVERFEKLRQDMASSFDKRYMPVLRGADNVIMDGQHRCCILLDRFGPDYEIDVLRIISK